MTPADLAVVAGIYTAAALNPTPATLGLLAESMSSGRRSGMAYAAGLQTGSVIWSLCAAFGLGAFLAAHPPVASGLRIAGGAYLLWLAIKAGRNALRKEGPAAAAAPPPRSLKQGFVKGLILQLSNVQSVLFWAALFSVVVAPGLPPSELAQPLILCALLGVVRFGGLALLFSTPRMIRLWNAARRPLEGGVAAFFGAAGIALIASR